MSRRIIVPCIYAVGIGIGAWLLVQHWTHVPLFLPYLIFLACPLMHLFMHHGHSGHHPRDEFRETGERK